MGRRYWVKLKELGIDSVQSRRITRQRSGVPERNFYWALHVCATYWAGMNSGIDRLWYPREPRRRPQNPYRKIKRGDGR